MSKRINLLRKLHHTQIMFSLRDDKLKPLKRSQNPDNDIIVSLTSYGGRIKTCHYAIRSMLVQTFPPNRIQLYIGTESSDVELPNELKVLMKYGLEIYSGTPDLKGHKKYYYCMQNNQRNRIITIDDDCIYSRDVVQSLIIQSNKFPDSVIARRVHRIRSNHNRLLPYTEWDYEWLDDDPHPRNSLLAVGVGGVLYPSQFASSGLLDKDALERCALYADDIWLKCYEMSRGIKVVWAPNNHPHPIQLGATKTSGLNQVNIDNGGNDRALSKCLVHFHISNSAFIDYL